MRVRIHLASGAVVDAEEFSADNGATWREIEVGHVAAAMGATAGYTVVRDAFTQEWRAFRNALIESIGPSPDLDLAVEREAEARIARRIARDLPARIAAAAPVIEPPTHGRPPDAGPVAGGRPSRNRTGGVPL